MIVMNIKIYKFESNKTKLFLFFKDNYLIADLEENKKNLIFVEHYEEHKAKKHFANITTYNRFAIKEIELYDFIFSNYADRLFFNRPKQITYHGNMQYALKVDKELTEYFQNISD